MNINKFMIIISAIISVTAISACTPVDKVISKEKPIVLSFINDKGKFVVVNVKTGKIIPPCKARPTEDFKACRGPFIEYTKNAKPGTLAGKSLATGSKVEVIEERTIKIIRWVGSECISYYDDFEGVWFEWCD